MEATETMDQLMLEQSLKQMWQDIQRLRAENQRLRECLFALGRGDLVNSYASQSSFLPLPEETKTITTKPSNNSPMAFSSESPTQNLTKSKISLMSALNGYYSRAANQEGADISPPAFVNKPLNIDVGLVKQLSVEQLNSLPYGVVTTDRDGIVLSYNDTESRLAGVPRDRVLMRSFFKDVAPCTQVKEFEGRFQSFARGQAKAIEQFDFVFNLASGTQYVTIIFTPGRARGTINIVMTRR